MLNLTINDLKLLEKFPKYSQDGKGEEAEVVLKIFNPAGRGSWYILEAEKMYDGKDYLCFGYVESPLCADFNEYGYFLLSELMKADVPQYLKDGDYEVFLGFASLEVDRSFASGTKMKKVFEEINKH